MYEQDNNTMMERTQFMFPSQIEGDFSDEELSEDMEGVTLSLPRAKIPGGGTLQFEITSDDPENPDYAKSIVGVLLYTHMANAYWPESEDSSSDEPPMCQSWDGKCGHGTPGGSCLDCMLNQYGSSNKGGGKACKNMRMLYILRNGESMPLQLALPPTSLKPYSEFVSAAFLSRRRGICSGLVQISLKKKVNETGHDYSVAVFKKLYDFSGEDLAAAKSLSAGCRMQIKEMNERRAESYAAQAQEICEYQDIATELPDNEANFMAASVIDGEREALPA